MGEAKRLGHAKRLLSTLRYLRAEGDLGALDFLLMLYRDGLRSDNGAVLVKPNKSAARRYMYDGARLGSGGALVQLADELSRSASRPDQTRAILLYKRAVALGYTSAALSIAHTYLAAANLKQAKRWFSYAARHGNPSAELQLALAGLYGGPRTGSQRCLSKLIELAEDDRLSDFERYECLAHAANALRTGWRVRRDFEGSLALLKKAMRMGSLAARGLLEDIGLEP